MNWLGVSAGVALVLLLAALTAWLVPLGSARRLGGWRGWLLAGLRAGWLAAALVLAVGLRWPLQPDSRAVMVALHAVGGGAVPAAWRDAFRWQHVRLAGNSVDGWAREGRPPLEGPSDLGASMEEWAGDDGPPDGFVLLGSADPVGIRQPPAPLFVVRERHPDAERQLLMVGLEAPQTAVPGLSFPISVSFRGGPGCGGEEWSVRLLGPAGEENVRRVICDAAVTHTVELRSLPPSPGTWDYQVEWQGLGQETQSAEVSVDVTAEPMAVLFLEESPGWEVTFLRRSMKKLLGAQPHTFARLSTHHLFRGPDLEVPSDGYGLEDLSPDRFRLLVLREPVLSRADADWIRRFVAHRGGALVLLGSAPEELEFLAPLPAGEGVMQGAGPVTATPLGRGHPVLDEVSDRLPAMSAPQLEFSPAMQEPLATKVLARVGAQAWMGVRRFGAGRVLQIAGPETYRWKMRGESPAAVYDGMWGSAMDWLVAPAGPRQRILAAVSAAVPGSRVPVQVDLRDEHFEPENSPARLRNGPALLPVPFRPGSFRGWITTGEARQRVALQRNSLQGAWIGVAGASGAAADHEALSEVASRSGGRILYPDDPPPEIEPGVSSVSSVDWKRARESFWPPAILLALAAAEWGARRRWGCEG